MRIAFDELVPEGEEVTCVGFAQSLHEARAMKFRLEEAHLDFAVEVEPHASFEVEGPAEGDDRPLAAFFVAASDAHLALGALRATQPRAHA